MAISCDGAGGEIAELVPSVSAGILLRVCLGYASQPLTLLAKAAGAARAFSHSQLGVILCFEVATVYLN